MVCTRCACMYVQGTDVLYVHTCTHMVCTRCACMYVQGTDVLYVTYCVVDVCTCTYTLYTDSDSTPPVASVHKSGISLSSKGKQHGSVTVYEVLIIQTLKVIQDKKW